jgi:hypothetical protein
MAAVKKSNIRIDPQLFRILYANGDRDHIHAAGFNYHPKAGDLIKFFDSDTAEIKDVLLRAPEVASVIAHSRIVEAPLVVELHSQVKNLEARMDALEKNLVNVVASALDIVLEKRGLQLSPE